MAAVLEADVPAGAGGAAGVAAVVAWAGVEGTFDVDAAEDGAGLGYGRQG